MAMILDWFKVAAILAAMALTSSAVGEGERDEKTSPVDTVPAVVKATIERESKGGQLGKIEPALKNGVTVYFVQYSVNGEQRMLLVASDGQVLERLSGDDIDD